MRDFATKTDNIGDTLGATGFNAYIAELENIATDAGFTLDPEAGPDTDLNMLGKAVAMYASGAYFYVDSGSADTYTLARIGLFQSVRAYFDGMHIAFYAGNANTGSSTVNVDSLGSKDLTMFGTALQADEVNEGTLIEAIYNAGSGEFEIQNIRKRVVIYDTSSGSPFTWTKKAGLKFLEVELAGAGGGGGGVDGQGAGTFAGGSGAGGGGYSRKTIPESSLGATETVTIGLGGVGGIASADGTDGNITSFGTHLQATGGKGGLSETASATVHASKGQEGGLGSGGNINSYGGVGGDSCALATASTLSGKGGDSMFGGGRVGRSTDSIGHNGVSPGSGGSGASVRTVATDYNGGDGADGICVVTEHY